MAIKTTHTVLARVTSHGSGGRARILVGHYALSDDRTDPFLTNVLFKGYEVGSLLIVELTLSGRRRRITRANLAPSDMTRGSFKIEYAGTLDREAETYNRKLGLKSSIGEPTSVSMSLDDEPEEFEEIVFQSEPEFTFAEEAHKEVFETEWATKVYISDADNRILESMKNLVNVQNAGILMIGPSGFGKTTIPQAKAREWGWNFLKWDCATTGDDASSFFGSLAAKDGSTIDENGQQLFVETDFTKMLQTPNTVIVLDEINRLSTIVLNALFPILDDTGETTVFGHRIVRAENVMIFATANIGYEYTGTFVLDTALMNRFIAKVLVGALPKEVEKSILVGRTKVNTPTAHRIVDTMTTLRKLNTSGQIAADVSTRMSIQVGYLTSTGLSIKDALTYTLINQMSPEEGKIVLDSISL